MTEKILDAFKTLGFELEEQKEIGYAFQYENTYFIWNKNEDTKFLNLVVPGVLDKKEGDELRFYKLIDHLNGILKYVKVNTHGDCMGLFYERELLDSDENNLEEIIENMIIHLEASLQILRMMIKAASEDTENENSDKTNEESGFLCKAREDNDKEEKENA